MSLANQQPNRFASRRQPQPIELPSLTPPAQFVTALRDNLLALGILCLLMRLYLIHKTAIPLSAADLAAYDPTISKEAARRALRRLVRIGGLVVCEGKGTKRWYVPGWGLVNGRPREWDASRKMFNRPPHLAVLRFDARIFDYFFGRLALNDRLTATVERYVSAPPLTLSDIGAYLALQGGLEINPGQMEKLARCGLVRDGQPCQLPSDGDDILRWISQARLFSEDAPALTEKGLRRLGLAPAPAAQAPESTGQPLVYMPLDELPAIPPINEDRIGHCVGHRVGSEALKTPQKAEVLPAPGADNPQQPFAAPDMTWNQKHLKHDPTLPSQVAGFREKRSKHRKEQPPEPLPTTPTAELLQSLGARPGVIRELCHIDFEQASKIIAYGRGRADVQSLAGWVVSALRDHRDHGWSAPEPAKPASGMLDLEKYTTGEYARFFSHDQEAQSDAASPAAAASDVEPAAIKDQAPPEVLMRWIYETLSRAFRREERELVGRLRLLDAGDVPLFACATAGDLAELDAGLGCYIRNVCYEFGWQHPPKFVLDEESCAQPAV